ncbi:MAG: GNAT family N-acetyltransferase [Clostridiales bacterium]|jgi:ribosomal protein S18 acetylase RimI-like enzyme|nr:GNAT family N-acetyltransferase [Clostridiales bacterium]
MIRPMRVSDIDMLLANFAEQGWQKPRDVFEEYLSKQDKALYTFAAESEQDIAGYAILYKAARGGPFADKHIPEIGDLIVFEKYQRRGIGNVILDAAEKKAAELSEAVSLAVGLHSGYGAAQRIYIKRGYMPDGSGCWHKNAPLSQYADCVNDDDLVLYLLKVLRA